MKPGTRDTSKQSQCSRIFPCTLAQADPREAATSVFLGLGNTRCVDLLDIDGSKTRSDIKRCDKESAGSSRHRGSHDRGVWNVGDRPPLSPSSVNGWPPSQLLICGCVQELDFGLSQVE